MEVGVVVSLYVRNVMQVTRKRERPSLKAGKATNLFELPRVDLQTWASAARYCSTSYIFISF